MIAALRRLAAQPGAHLLPVRGFLGVTFTFAGLQKLANPAFFRSSSPTSIQQQLADVRATSPIHLLVSLAQHAPVVFGVLIAFGELAAGLATLAGLLTRAAAGGGALLALTFFLTVSWTTSPYYYGADIVFVFAWLTLALHGPMYPSLDLAIAERRDAALAQVAHGTSKRARQIAEQQEGQIDRRAAMSRGLLAGCGAALTLALGGLTALVGRKAGGTNTPAAAGGPHTLGGGTTNATGATGGTGVTGVTGGTGTGSTTTTVAGGSGTGAGKPKGTKLGPAADVPVGGAASFTDPSNGMPAYVVQPTAGTFAAFSAVCTHQGCTVNFEQSSETFNCPCHSSIFNARTGAVLSGPAPAPLPAIPIADSGGQLYVNG